MDTKSALQDALHANDLDTIKASLLNTPLTARQNELDTSLILAMPQSSLETIELLLDLGAKLKEASLFSAVAREETAVFKLLIDAGWDINSTEFQRTAAHLAIKRVPLLRWLLEQGASPNTKSTRQPGSCAQRLTPLAQAATLADPTALEVLLFYGAQDPMAIFHAIGLRGGQGNGTVTMKVLIQRGADVDYVSTRWATPLCQSVRIADEEKLKLLLDHGANPAIRSRGRSTNAYEYAVELGRTRFFDIMEATCGSSAP